MVIESAQRDGNFKSRSYLSNYYFLLALTGEPISHDVSMWQQAREENKVRTLELSRLLDSMMESLQSTNVELQVRAILYVGM